MIRSYVKLAVKVLLRRKFFTFISLFGIALTLTVLMVATALLDHAFGPVAPETRAERTVAVHRLDLKGESWTWGGEPGYQFLDRYVRDLPGAEAVSLFTEGSRVAAFRDGAKIDLFLKRTDGEFWRILDFSFLEGAPFTNADEADGRSVAVISRSTREKLYDDEDAVGRAIEVDGQRFRVVGVVEDVSQLRPLPSADVWVPISTAKTSAYRESFLGGWNALILAPSPELIQKIQSEYLSRVAQAELPEDYDEAFSHAESRFEHVARDFFNGDKSHASYGRHFQGVIVLAVLLFLVLPSLNLVNLNTSRILERAPEIGVRKAYGASSATLVGQFVVENLVLTFLGGALGLVFSGFVLDLVSDAGIFPHAELGLNLRVFAWGLLLTLFFGVVSGAYPAWRMSRLQPVAALGGRSSFRRS